jgi:hypothetical protein
MPSGEEINWTTEQLEKIKSLLQEGKSLRFIGNLFGVNAGVIKRLNDVHKWRDVKKDKEDKYKFVLSLYRLPPHGKGLSGNLLRTKYKIPESVIKRALEMFDLGHEYRKYEDSPGGAKPSELNREISKNMEVIQKLLDEGNSVNDIASLFNTSPMAMRGHLRRLGISPSIDLKSKRKEFIRERSLEMMRDGYSLEEIMKEYIAYLTKQVNIIVIFRKLI